MVLAVAFVANVSNPVLPLNGGAVGQIDEPPVFTEAVFGFVNVTGRLFNVSVSSVSIGPYMLNRVPADGRSAAYFVVCYQVDSCLIGFYVINDSAIHDYVGSVSSVPVRVSLSDGEAVRGSVAMKENPVAEPGPSSGLIAMEATVYASWRVLETDSNLSAWILLNDSVTSPIVQVTIGDRTVNSSYFARQTISVTLLNGTLETILGPIIIHGPVVYYVMENAGHQLPVTLWLQGGGQVNFTLLAESWVYTVLRP
jgi:hypothetical protein